MYDNKYAKKLAYHLIYMLDLKLINPENIKVICESYKQGYIQNIENIDIDQYTQDTMEVCWDYTKMELMIQ